MIPHKLQLKNFLSYGAQLQTIDFGHYHLICLSGKNGHGKSALLDAMTWAIWGQARKTVAMIKADQGLLRLGQTQMMVIFDFECNGIHYRIRREYVQTSAKSYTVLEFGILDTTTNCLVALTDKTIKLTQEKIENTLNLDFESFVNSSFLRQGNANEFSKKSSKDRKEVLATILGLNHYEVIRKIALNKIKQAQIQEHTLAAFQDKAHNELKKAPQLEEDLALQIKQKNILTKEYVHLMQEKEALDKQLHTIALAQQKLELYTTQDQNVHNQETTLHTTLHAQRALWRTIRAKSKQLPLLAQLEQQKINLIQSTQQQQQLLQKNLEIKTELLQHKEQLQTIEQQHKDQIAKDSHKKLQILERLRLDKQNTLHQLQTLEKEYATLANLIQNNTQKQTELAEQLSPQEALLHELQSQEEQLEKRKETFQRLVAQGNMLKSSLKDLNQKQHLTQELDDPSCPLCEQNLSAARRKFLRQKFDNQERLLNHQINRLARMLPLIKSKLITQHALCSSLKKEYDKTIVLTTTIKDLEKTVLTAQARQQELQPLLQELSSTHQLIEQEIQTHEKNNSHIDTTALLHNDAAYQEIFVRYTALQKELDSSPYNTAVHQQIQKDLHEIERKIDDYSDLLQEVAQQNERTNTIAQLCIRLKEYKQQRLLLATEIKTYTTVVEHKQTFQDKATAWHEQFALFETAKDTVMREITRLQTESNKLKELELELAALSKQSQALMETINDYQTIAHATGKDGIQALLIEDAIPEIEYEANYLLSKLSNNQAQIFIESLRDLKSGGTKETLDIKISDAAGIRPYELFSGGEGFRIDFALRIAISKLLARRAGTALQTLIIDEGFGSQDEEGLAHIMDAIYKIQDDFARIIIVSHLPALKDQFPVHFVVEKGPQGSTIKIIEYD